MQIAEKQMCLLNVENITLFLKLIITHYAAYPFTYRDSLPNKHFRIKKSSVRFDCDVGEPLHFRKFAHHLAD